MQSTPLEEVYCVLCGGNRTKKCVTAKCYLVPLEPSAFDVVECLDCGLRYTNPRPIQSEIDKYYPCNYGPHRDSHSKTKLLVFKQWLERRTLELKLGYPSSKNHSSYINCIHKLIISVLLSYYPFLPYIRNGRLLEVGSGTGRLLTLMKDYGWDTYGVELGGKAAEFARNRNLRIFTGTLMDARFENSFFDSICYHHVLEHVYDPYKELQEVMRTLKPGGHLYIAVPNIDSLEAKVFGEYWNPLQLPIHLYHFSPITLKQLLKRSGFGILCLKTYSPAEQFYDSLLRYLKKSLHNVPLSFLSGFSKVLALLAIPFLWVLHLFNKGSAIRVLAQKNL